MIHGLIDVLEIAASRASRRKFIIWILRRVLPVSAVHPSLQADRVGVS
jgi:hypothetical protein